MTTASRLLRLLRRGFTATWLAAFALAGAGPAASAASPQEQAAQEIATLFRSARKVISDNQALINDAEKGDKGLSAAAVQQKTRANYQAATGKAVDESNPALKALLDAVGWIMADAQPLINEPGKGFKGFLPAVFARQVAEAASEKLRGQVFIKLTAPKDYLRNRANRPDEWENNAIEAKFRSAGWQKGAAYGENGEHKGKKAYRLALPEYYGPSCLECHGEPKGGRDITGGLKEGAKLDELGGAVIVVVYDN